MIAAGAVAEQRVVPGVVERDAPGVVAVRAGVEGEAARLGRQVRACPPRGTRRRGRRASRPGCRPRRRRPTARPRPAPTSDRVRHGRLAAPDVAAEAGQPALEARRRAPRAPRRRRPVTSGDEARAVHLVDDVREPVVGGGVERGRAGTNASAGSSARREPAQGPQPLRREQHEDDQRRSPSPGIEARLWASRKSSTHSVAVRQRGDPQPRSRAHGRPPARPRETARWRRTRPRRFGSRAGSRACRRPPAGPAGRRRRRKRADRQQPGDGRRRTRAARARASSAGRAGCTGRGRGRTRARRPGSAAPSAIAMSGAGVQSAESSVQQPSATSAHERDDHRR